MENKIPNHVAIIMDGNGRWAQKRDMKRTKGHQKGAQVLKEISEYIEHKKRMGFSAIDIKIKYKENVKILEDTGFSIFRKRRGVYAIS